jgi:hypothetical protein
MRGSQHMSMTFENMNFRNLSMYSPTEKATARKELLDWITNQKAVDEFCANNNEEAAIERVALYVALTQEAKNKDRACQILRLLFLQHTFSLGELAKRGRIVKCVDAIVTKSFGELLDEREAQRAEELVVE